MAAASAALDGHLGIELIARVQADAAGRRLAETPYPNGFMPVYADLYLDGALFISLAVVPNERALRRLRVLAKQLNADTIAITTDTYIAAGIDPRTAPPASIESRFEVGDPRVSEAIAVTVGSLNDGLLSVHIPYVRSVMDGLELRDPVISGLDVGDDLLGPFTDGLVEALGGVGDDEAATARERIMTPTDVEVAILLYEREEWAGFDRLDPGWYRTRLGISNVDATNPLAPLLAAAVIS